MRSIGLALPLILVLSALGCASTPVREIPWVVVQSPRFEILSSLSAEETQGLARELERFHALVYAVTGAPQFESPIPTRIYVFENKLHYKRYGPRNTAGAFAGGLRAHTMVLADYSKKMGASQIILHEYTHYVLNNGTLTTYPLWYNEGFAELLSSARVHEDKIAIGDIPKVRIPSFQYGAWLPIAQIVAATDYRSVSPDEVHMLYAESWALVHYLTLDREERGSMGRDLTRYMELVASGVEPVDAFEDAFGDETGQVGRKIKRILEKNRLRVIGIPIANLRYDRTEPTVRIPTRVEVATRLGQLQLRLDDGEAAQLEFEAALALDPDAPRALAGLGDALKSQKKWKAAEPNFLRAIEIAPQDPMNHLDLAEFLHDKALEAPSAEERRRLLAEARQIYAHTRSLDDGIPEAWAMDGRTYLAPGEDPRQALELLDHALEMLPSSDVILESLAEARVALGQDREAAKLIKRAFASKLEGKLQVSVGEAIDEIKEARKEQAREAEEREKAAAAN